MKKIISVFCFLTLCTLFTSCSGSTSSSDAMTLINTETGKKLTLNMTKYEISQELWEEFDNTKCGGIHVGFEKEKSVFYIQHINRTSDNSFAPWETSKGISLNSGIQEFKKQYPDAVVSDNKRSATVYFVYENNKYKSITEEEKEQYNLDELFFIELNCTANNTTLPDSLTVGKYKNALYGSWE